MSTEAHQIVVNQMPVEIVRKDITNLHLGVYPPVGRIRVSAPLHLSDSAVRLAVIGKLGWIKRQRSRFVAQTRETAREWVSGESHYYFGRRYRLRVIEQEGRPEVRIATQTRMELRVRPGAIPTEREQLLQRWYRRNLRAEAAPLVEKWRKKLNLPPVTFQIKRMKTKWCTCNIEARRIWLNLELAKKPRPCLEYIIVHELIHLLERHHNNRFQKLMDKALPPWRTYLDELNATPLAHEEWEY